MHIIVIRVWELGRICLMRFRYVICFLNEVSVCILQICDRACGSALGAGGGIGACTTLNAFINKLLIQYVSFTFYGRNSDAIFGEISRNSQILITTHTYTNLQFDL